MVAKGVIDIVENGHVLGAFVGHHDLHRFTEWHGQVAVETAALWTGECRGLEGRHAAESGAEKISERRADGRLGGLIPVHIYPHAPQNLRCALVDGRPDASHSTARVVDFGENELRAGLEIDRWPTLPAGVFLTRFALLSMRVFGTGPARFHSVRNFVDALRKDETGRKKSQ